MRALTVAPAARYAELLASSALRADAAQARAVVALTRLHAALLASSPRPPRGVYLHSGPGRGKTALASLLVHPAVLHVHAHAFMRDMHARMAAARGDVGAAAVGLVAGDARVLALDEMEVTDIADALVLARMLAALRARGVALLATSNRAPEALYAGGLNHELFQPAFGRAIRESCDVLCLDGDGDGGGGGEDYRRVRTDDDAAAAAAAAAGPHTLIAPSARGADAVWRALCGALAAPVGERRVAVPNAGRDVVARAACGRAARVSFADVCRGNWSAACYFALAAEFDVLLLDGVPALAAASDDALRRFVLLVDVLYARGAVLVLAVDARAPWADVSQLFAGVGAGDGGSAPVAAPAAPALRVVDAGGASGRLTTMVSPTLEWSATGRVGASLADLAPAGRFVAFSAARCASRLHEMMRSEWVARSGVAAGAVAGALAAALPPIDPRPIDTCTAAGLPAPAGACSAIAAHARVHALACRSYA